MILAFELLLVAVVALLVVGPERLPDAIRTTARWWSGLKRTLQGAREELEREVGADDIRRELHNERILREIEESRREMERTFNEANREVSESLQQQQQQQQQQEDKPQLGESTETEEKLRLKPYRNPSTHARKKRIIYRSRMRRLRSCKIPNTQSTGTITAIRN